MKVPDGIDALVEAVPSSIPPEMFEEVPASAPASCVQRAAPPLPIPRPPSLPRISVESPLPVSTTRVRAVPPAPERAPAPPVAPPSIPEGCEVELRESSSFDSRPRPVLAPTVRIARPVRTRSRRVPLLVALSVGVVAGASAAALVLQARKPDGAAAASTPSSVVEVVETATDTSAPMATPAAADDAAAGEHAAEEPGAAAAAYPAGMGMVRTTGALTGRRIFVDGRTVGQTPDAVLVKCGLRLIRIGSAGRATRIAVPCGSEITFAGR